MNGSLALYKTGFHNLEIVIIVKRKIDKTDAHSNIDERKLVAGANEKRPPG